MRPITEKLHDTGETRRSRTVSPGAPVTRAMTTHGEARPPPQPFPTHLRIPIPFLKTLPHSEHPGHTTHLRGRRQDTILERNTNPLREHPRSTGKDIGARPVKACEIHLVEYAIDVELRDHDGLSDLPLITS